MNVAVIPARGGSKRIPRKNIREFHGKPMIAWSIEAAKGSGLFDRVLVSTDDAEIADLARGLGAEVPFVRPAELANDHAGTLPVIRHAVRFLLDRGDDVEAACCIYATAPFLRREYLAEGLDALREDPELEFAFSVVSFGFPIFRAVKLDGEKRTRMFWPEHELTRSQDLEPAYHDAGQFYWGTRAAWLGRERIFSSRSRGVVLPPHLVQDIDTPEDWERAEWMAKALSHG